MALYPCSLYWCDVCGTVTRSVGATLVCSNAANHGAQLYPPPSSGQVV